MLTCNIFDNTDLHLHTFGHEQFKRKLISKEKVWWMICLKLKWDAPFTNKLEKPVHYVFKGHWVNETSVINCTDRILTKLAQCEPKGGSLWSLRDSLEISKPCPLVNQFVDAISKHWLSENNGLYQCETSCCWSKSLAAQRRLTRKKTRTATTPKR